MYHKPGTIKFAKEAPYPYNHAMASTKIGYARCSTDRQDLSAQKQALENLGVSPDRIYTDHGLTGTNRARPGLDQALAAVREGDVLVVPKLDRLARSVPDARAIAEQLEKKGVKLAIGASVYDPTDPMGKMFFNILATFAEFEADLIKMRTREGMAIARAKGSRLAYGSPWHKEIEAWRMDWRNYCEPFERSGEVPIEPRRVLTFRASQTMRDRVAST